MRKVPIKITIILNSIFVFTFTSCKNELPKKNQEQTKAKTENLPNHGVEEKSSFDAGTWRIDSVSENNIVIDRLNKKKDIQVFNFRKGGVFSAMTVTQRSTKDQVIGKWDIGNDSLYIINDKGAVLMQYKFNIQSKNMTLAAGFEVSANNKNKPTFHLSKYND